MGSCLDLRKYQDPNTKDGSQIADAFSMIISGKKGYKAVIERRKPTPKCVKCTHPANSEDQKFCAQCGGKMAIPITNCPGCQRLIDENEKFCTGCGHNIEAIIAAQTA
ncbi:MAG: zinc ribbon domain-containing protein [Nanoarchaeota archaeon]|nr:zinc ribbon domain-containing protein [Nanoarchaeota archaeon]